MKRGITLLLAVVVFFVGDRIGGRILDNLLYRSPQRFPTLYSGRFDADTVVIGNSRGLNMLDWPFAEQESDTSIINLSHNAMPPQIARAIFADYLEHNPKPKRLVIEVSNVTTPTAEGTMLDYKPFWGRSDRLRNLGKAFSPLTAAACRVTHLYQYNSEMFLRAMSYLASGNTDQNAGMRMMIPPALVEETEAMEPIELTADPQEVEALRGLVDDARAAEVDVQLVLAPYLPAYAARISNLDEFVNDMSEALGQEVQDSSRSLDATDEFADRVHMNPKGTRKFTQQLIDQGILK
jgi:hypothetical protein